MVLPELDTPFSRYVHQLLRKLYGRFEAGHRFLSPCPLVLLVKEDPNHTGRMAPQGTAEGLSLKSQFLAALIEDRSESAPSYALFLSQLRDKLNPAPK
jgi:hypothetical protein